MSSLGEAVVEVGADTTGFRDDVKKGVNSGLSSASKSMQNLGKGMQSVGTKMTLGITTPLLGIAAQSVKTAGQFEASMNVLQAATGMGDKAMKGLQSQAVDLGSSTVFSANEAADAMLELGKAGFNAAQISKAVPEVMNLAATEGLALGQSAGIVSSALSQFSLDAGEAGQVVNALAGASNASRASVATLSESMKLVGSAASGVGLTVQQTAGTLAALADSGLDGSVAGTALAAMFNRLIPQTEKARGAMEDLGLDFVKGNGQFESITNIAQQLQDELGRLSPAARKAKLSAIFGNDASTLAAVNAVMKAGATGIRDYTKAASDQSAAQKLAEARMKGVQGAVEKMKGSMETAGLAIGQALIPFITKAASIIGNLADKFSGLDGNTQKIILVFAAVAAAIGPVLVVLGTLIASVGAIAGVFAGVTAAVAAPVAVFALLAIGLGILLAKSEAARAVMVGAFNQIKTAVMAAVGPMVAMIQGQLLPAFMQMWPIIEKVGVIILKVFAGAVVGAVKGAIQAISGIVQVITGVVQVISGILTGDWSRVWDGLKNIVGGSLDAVIGLIKVWLNVGVLGIFRKGFALLTGLTRGGWGALKGVFSKGVSTLGSVLGKVVQIVTAPFRLGFSVLKAVVSTAWGVIKAVFSTALQVIKAVVTGNFSAIPGIIGGFLGTIRGIVASGFGALKGIVANAWGAVKGAVSSGVSAAVGVVKGLPGKVAGVITGGIGALKSAGSALIGGLVAGVTSRIGDAVDAVKDGLGKIKGLLPGSPIKWGPLVGWNNGGAGKRLMSLLAYGIRSGIPAVADAVEGAVALIANNFASVEHGPAVQGVMDTFAQITEGIATATQGQYDQQSKAAEAHYNGQVAKYRKDVAEQEKALKKKFDGKVLKKKLAALEDEEGRHLRKLEKGHKEHLSTLAKNQKSSTATLTALANRQQNAIMQQAADWDLLSLSLEGVRTSLDNALSDLESKTNEMNSLARSVGDSLMESVFGSTGDVPPSFDAIISGLQGQEAAAQRYGEVMAALAGLNLNATSFRQIADEGVAGLAAAEALLASGTAGVQQVNALQASINAYAETAGNTVASYLLGAGVALAQSAVDGFQAQEATLLGQMTTLGNAIALAFQSAMSTVALPGGTGAGGGGGGGGGSNAGKHQWTPVSKSNRKCSICGKPRSNAVHTNRDENNAAGNLSSIGGWAMVGERGRELVRLPGGSRVYPAQQTERIVSGKEQRPVEQHFHLPTGDPEAIAMAALNRLAGRI
jgi:TP901 family phage tail tape measure protein